MSDKPSPNLSNVRGVRADIVVQRYNSEGHAADDLRFSVQGGRVETLDQVGEYVKDRINDFVDGLSPDATELARLRDENAALRDKLRQLQPAQRPRPQPQPVPQGGRTAEAIPPAPTNKRKS